MRAGSSCAGRWTRHWGASPRGGPRTLRWLWAATLTCGFACGQAEAPGPESSPGTAAAGDGPPMGDVAGGLPVSETSGSTAGTGGGESGMGDSGTTLSGTTLPDEGSAELEETRGTAELRVHGLLEKGPLLAGAEVWAERLDSGGQATGVRVAGASSDDRGRFSLVVAEAGLYRISARARFFDEWRAVVTSAAFELSAVVLVDGAQSDCVARGCNLNLLTTLIAGRQIQALARGFAFAEARRLSQSELVAELGLGRLPTDPIPDFAQLTLAGGQSAQGDGYLLGVSASMLAWADERAAEGLSPAVELQTIVRSWSSNFAATGRLPAEGPVALRQAAAGLNPARIREALAARLHVVGETHPPADMELSLDVDGDGVVNAADNCRNQMNPGQADRDGDGLGDACDPCTAGVDRLCNCGDGVLDDDEACDDGNSDPGDACPAACAKARCGDGFIWRGQEACDPDPARPSSNPLLCDESCQARDLVDELFVAASSDQGARISDLRNGEALVIEYLADRIGAAPTGAMIHRGSLGQPASLVAVELDFVPNDAALAPGEGVYLLRTQGSADQLLRWTGAGLATVAAGLHGFRRNADHLVWVDASQRLNRLAVESERLETEALPTTGLEIVAMTDRGQGLGLRAADARGLWLSDQAGTRELVRADLDHTIAAVQMGPAGLVYALRRRLDHNQWRFVWSAYDEGATIDFPQAPAGKYWVWPALNFDDQGRIWLPVAEQPPGVETARWQSSVLQYWRWDPISGGDPVLVSSINYNGSQLWQAPGLELFPPACNRHWRFEDGRIAVARRRADRAGVEQFLMVEGGNVTTEWPADEARGTCIHQGRLLLVGPAFLASPR